MNPLMWLRLAGIAGIIGLLYGGYKYIDHQGYKRGKDEVQALLDKYKETINDQLSKAKIHAETEKKLQDAKYESAKHDYADSQSKLDNALKRLRKPQAVPGNSAVQVAGCGSSPMPAEATDTGGTTVTLATFEGACERSFFEAAMRTTLQCERLIEFVR